MKLDFIGHEIKDGDPLWIIRADLTRVESYRDGNRVIPIDKNYDVVELQDGKNSRVDLKRSWVENYFMNRLGG